MVAPRSVKIYICQPCSVRNLLVFPPPPRRDSPQASTRSAKIYCKALLQAFQDWGPVNQVYLIIYLLCRLEIAQQASINLPTFCGGNREDFQLLKGFLRWCNVFEVNKYYAWLTMLAIARNTLLLKLYLKRRNHLFIFNFPNTPQYLVSFMSFKRFDHSEN